MNAVGKNARRLLAVAGIAALGVAGIAAGASAAAGPGQEGAPGEGSLIIHKRVGSQGTAGTGSALDPAPGAGLGGVEFTIWQVGREVAGTCTALDLAQAADWALVPTGGAPATVAGVEAAGFCVTEIDSGLTSTDAATLGDLTFDELDLGLYYVQETNAPANVVSRAAPFYVTVPLPNATGWNYNVHVYPKNQTASLPTKTIEARPSATVVGSNVVWTISATVPNLNAGETFTVGNIKDLLDDRLEFVEAVVQQNGVPLAFMYSVDPTTNELTLTFTPGDLVQGATITAQITTKVVSVGNGIIDNDTYSSTFNNTTTPGEQVPYTYWGQLAILKTDNSTPALNLAGATFQVFEKGAEACPATAPATGAVATGTSNASGVVQWAGATPASPLGLWIANSPNGELTNPSKDYCLYETVVPVGHTATPITNPITITPGAPSVASNLTVVNPKKEGPNLPLTGSNGTMLLTLGGLALVGIGGGAALVTRNRRRNDAA